MGDETTVRIFAKLDDIGERLARMEAAQGERKAMHEHEIRLMEQELMEVKGAVEKMGERVGRLENASTGLFAVKNFVAAAIALAGSIVGTTAALWGMMR